MRIRGIQSGDVPSHWNEAYKFLGPAIRLSHGRMSSDSILTSLMGQELQLWFAEDGAEIKAALVTELLVYKTGLKAVRVVLLGGVNMKDWLHFASTIDAWGKSKGCSVIEAMGVRSGWARVSGWKQTGVNLEKDLSNA